MIAAWMLYSLLSAFGLAAAAMLAERALLTGRQPVRGVWVIALGLSLLIPAAAHRFATIAGPDPARLAAAHGTAFDPALDSIFTSSAAAPAARQASGMRWSWRALTSRADGPLAIGWLILSAALLLRLLSGLIILAWVRSSWRRDVVLGIDVLVSRATGPALVGTMSPAIVVPEWALAMDPPQLALMLQHEEEHRRARDGQLLTLAQCALIVMPWNLALWWQLARLQLAVELDCDARVLRGADARSYGDLLLEVVRPRPSTAFLGATAFAERASQLEQRIRAISRQRGPASRRMRSVAVSIGIAVVAVAWMAPRPPVPSSASSSTAVPTPLAAATSEVTAPPKQTVVNDPINLRPPAALSTDSLFPTLFSGISLTPERATQARALLDGLRSAQTARMTNILVRFNETMPQRQALLAKLDSALVALLPNQGDVATLRPRLPQVRSGGDRLYSRLFDGIAMSAEQEAAARAAIRRFYQDARALMPPLEPPLLGVRRNPTRVVMRPSSDSAFLALVSSDADRAMLQSRISIANPPPQPPT